MEAETPPHGYHIATATDPGLDPANREDPRHVRVGEPVIDYVQKALDDARDGYRKQYPDSNMNGFFFHAEVVDE